MASVFDLKKNYAFYGAYHTDGANKAIHILCVWPILFSALLLLQYTPPLIPGAAVGVPWGGVVSFNSAAVVSVVYASFYLFMERRAGAVAATLVAGCFFGSQATLLALGADAAWKVAAVMQVFCWSAQFAGHGVFEGRAPALLDNLVQAFLMAPFFVLLEVLHMLIQFEPEVGFWDYVNKEIEKQTSLFKSKDKHA